MRGADLRTMQQVMGHKDIKMTMRYSHPTAEHKRKAVEVLNGVTTIFTTEAKSEKLGRIVNIGHR